MKKLAFIVMFMLALAVSVSAIGQVDLVSIPTQSVDPGQTATFTITVDNALAGTTIPSVDFTSTSIVGPTTLSAPTINSVTNVVNGTPQTVTFSVPVAANTPAGNYVATVAATETGNGANTDSIGYTLTVNSISTVTASETTVRINGQPGDTTDAAFTITNNGNVALTNVVITHDLGALEDGSRDATIDFTPSSIANLGVGGTHGIDVEIDVDSRFERRTFNGNIVVTATQGTFMLPFEVEIAPLVCVVGEVGGDLDVDIREPDDDQEFRAGDDIPLEVEVTNDGNSDLRVEVEAVLYNTDSDEIEDRASSSSRTIDEDDSYTFDFNLEVPSNADEDDDYEIYVKAFERGDEDEQCNDGENVDVVIEELEDFVQIDSFTVSPVSPTCGEDVFGSIRVVNRGSNDADVRVLIQNSELGLNEQSPTFELDPNGRNDYDKVVNFQFRVPDDAQSKTYAINARVDFNGESTGDSRTVSVTGCADDSSSSGNAVTGGSTTTTTTGSTTGTVDTEADGFVFQEKSVFDRFNTSNGIPTSAWLLIDLVLVLLVIFLIVVIVKKSRY